MTPAQQIRKAALGPVPKIAWQMLCGWIPCDLPAWPPLNATHTAVECGPHTDTDLIRFFLLFVAEALENE